VGIGAFLTLLFSTVVRMLFGELSRRISRSTAPAPRPAAGPVHHGLPKVFGWLICVFDQAANLLLRTLKIEPVHDVEHAATARDLEHIVMLTNNALTFRGTDAWPDRTVGAS
jgi:CBS domain containing-hemolysin-like protein